ncbi:hypothetical protein CICLE_v10024090mg [Citrus x clementina]|uniref:Uncharacterized protein n=1 Tax=Citrus clementina TaxID=85681 RepID=V4U300_CITCL|nr:hypothetical protein CICLE_v10024090mg [Citrus x clementina]
MIFKFSTPFKNLAFPSQFGNPPTTSIIKRWSLVNFLMAIKIFEIIIKLTRGKGTNSFFNIYYCVSMQDLF